MNNNAEPGADDVLKIASGPQNYLDALESLQAVDTWEPSEFENAAEYNASVRATLALAQTRMMAALVSVLAGMFVSGLGGTDEGELAYDWAAVIGMEMPEKGR